MTPEQLDAMQKAARAVMEYEENGGAAAEDEDAILSTWDQLVTPARVLWLIEQQRARLPAVAAS